MTRYIRICRTTNSKGKIIPYNSVEDIKKQVRISPNQDWYTSLFRYDKDAFDYYETNQSINGFKGKAELDELVFDLDCKNDPEKARHDATTLLSKLEKEGISKKDNCKVYFSGNKGFHVHVNLGQYFNNEEIKSICYNIASELESFDGVVYNTTRLFRVENTKHPKSGLYKIPLTIEELNSKEIKDIKRLATSSRNINLSYDPVKDLSFVDKYKTVQKKANKPVILPDTEGIRGIEDIDFKECPNNMPRCVFALTRGIMESGKGERSSIFLRLAAYYKNQGYSKEATYGALKGIARANTELYPEEDAFTKEEIWNTVIHSVFETSTWETRPGTTGIDPDNETFKRYCDAIEEHTQIKCCLHHRHSKPDTVVTIDSIENSFASFASNFKKNIVRTGIKFIDEHMKIAVGTTTLICGASGSGKSTLALNIMENANKLGQYTMFFSLDMHKNLVYLKLAQKLTNYNQDDILKIYENRDQKKRKEILDAIRSKYDKTFFDYSSTLTIEEMRDKVLATEEKTGKKIKLVMVDYASRVTGQFSDSYANARYNALKSPEIASDTDAAWIWINQVSRNTGSGSSPLRTKRVAKDSGDWEEAASGIINVWRPFMGKEEGDDIMRAFIAKNRMGKELERPLWWDGAKGVIKDMTQSEYEEYKEERESYENPKSESNKF